MDGEQSNEERLRRIQARWENARFDELEKAVTEWDVEIIYALLQNAAVQAGIECAPSDIHWLLDRLDAGREERGLLVEELGESRKQSDRLVDQLAAARGTMVEAADALAQWRDGIGDPDDESWPSDGDDLIARLRGAAPAENEGE